MPVKRLGFRALVKHNIPRRLQSVFQVDISGLIVKAHCKPDQDI